MKKGILKKLSCFLLIFAMAMTTVLMTGNVEAKAATKTTVTLVYSSSDWVNVTANTEEKIDFTLANNEGVEFDLYVAQPANGKFTVYNSAGTEVENIDFKTSDFGEVTELNAYGLYYVPYAALKAGDYKLGITFDADNVYAVKIYQAEVQATMSQTSMTLTQGFTKKLSVSGGSVKSWASKNKKVATVDKNGKVTAKKTGNTSIVATLKDGTKLICKVKVAANKYSDTKLTTSNCRYGDVYLGAYTASFDKKGNLVVKASLVNNYYYPVTSLKNIKIVVKDANGKKVVTHKVSKLATSLSSSSAKTLTFTIKKSELKNKKIDLRNATIVMDGKYYYRYY